jgi:hypothetical protein
MEAAAIMAIALANGGVSSSIFWFLWQFHSRICLFWDIVKHFFLCLQGKPPDWQDFVGIITLLVINSTISFIEENNAGNAAAALMARLAPKAKVCEVNEPLFHFKCVSINLWMYLYIGALKIWMKSKFANMTD